MSHRLTYLDSSALVKLAARERETGALRRFVHGRSILVSSALARTEVVRAIRPLGPAALRRARTVLERLRLIRLDDAVLETASMLVPVSLRTLDAIHLASAMAIGDDLDSIVIYDDRMRAAAEALGLPVAAPA